MIVLEDPPGFVVRTELQKAAFENGFRLERGVHSGWLRFGSSTVSGEIWVAGGSMNGPWLLSVARMDVASELGIPPAFEVDGPGDATFEYQSLNELYIGLDRTYRLGVSLPDAPLQRFLAETQSMPHKTEAERMVVQRIGQGLFREALLKYWNGCCPLTGIADIRTIACFPHCGLGRVRD